MKLRSKGIGGNAPMWGTTGSSPNVLSKGRGSGLSETGGVGMLVEAGGESILFELLELPSAVDCPFSGMPGKKE